jgi:thiol:disulfide interchange protein DsbD
MLITRLRWLHFAFLLMAPAAFSSADPLQAKHARLELIAENAGVSAGADFLVGVHFMLEPGWHIYWINPGDSGQPPVFQWQLPPGITASDVQWPRPQRLQSSAQIVDYGYRDDVLLMVPLHVTRVDNGGAPQITLNAKWLICREVCLPDHAQLHLSFPIAAKAQELSPAAPLFAEAKKLLPRALPPSWKARVISRKDNLVLVVESGRPIASADFFPLDPGQIDNAASQRFERTATGVNITLKKSDQLVRKIARLRGVLAFAKGTIYLVDAPVAEQ